MGARKISVRGLLTENAVEGKEVKERTASAAKEKGPEVQGGMLARQGKTSRRKGLWGENFTGLTSTHPEGAFRCRGGNAKFAG